MNLFMGLDAKRRQLWKAWRGKTLSDGTTAAQVYVGNSAIDISQYDNQAVVVSPFAGFDIPASALPSGVTTALINFQSATGAKDAKESVFIRWDAAANNTTCAKLIAGQVMLIAVPPTPGGAVLNTHGAIGMTTGATISITPVG